VFSVADFPFHQHLASATCMGQEYYRNRFSGFLVQ